MTNSDTAAPVVATKAGFVAQSRKAFMAGAAGAVAAVGGAAGGILADGAVSGSEVWMVLGLAVAGFFVAGAATYRIPNAAAS